MVGRYFMKIPLKGIDMDFWLLIRMWKAGKSATPNLATRKS